MMLEYNKMKSHHSEHMISMFRRNICLVKITRIWSLGRSSNHVFVASLQWKADVNGSSSDKLFNAERYKPFRVSWNTVLKRLVSKHRRSLWKPEFNGKDFKCSTLSTSAVFMLWNATFWELCLFTSSFQTDKKLHNEKFSWWIKLSITGCWVEISSLKVV